MVKAIALKRIQRDTNVQSREALDGEVVAEYARLMAEGEQFPPVTVFNDGGKDYWLADGFHRVEAAAINGENGIKADVIMGDKRDAMLYSAGANKAHGLRRSNADKRRAVRMLLSDEKWSQWSNREIARRCGVDEGMVRKYRDEFNASKHGSSKSVNRFQHDKWYAVFTGLGLVCDEPFEHAWDAEAKYERSAAVIGGLLNRGTPFTGYQVASAAEMAGKGVRINSVSPTPTVKSEEEPDFTEDDKAAALADIIGEDEPEIVEGELPDWAGKILPNRFYPVDDVLCVVIQRPYSDEFLAAEAWPEQEIMPGEDLCVEEYSGFQLLLEDEYMAMFNAESNPRVEEDAPEEAPEEDPNTAQSPRVITVNDTNKWELGRLQRGFFYPVDTEMKRIVDKGYRDRSNAEALWTKRLDEVAIFDLEQIKKVCNSDYQILTMEQYLREREWNTTIATVAKASTTCVARLKQFEGKYGRHAATETFTLMEIMQA